MLDNERAWIQELEKYRDTKRIVFKGGAKLKVLGVELRNGTVFISMEEDNGNPVDYERPLEKLGEFISLLNFTVQKVAPSQILEFHVCEKKMPTRAMEYHIATVWRRNNVPVNIIFSHGFSSGVYLSKNKRFQPMFEGDKIYFKPDPNGIKLVCKDSKGSRFGFHCRPFAKRLTGYEYSVDLIMIGQIESIVLTKIK